jgi:triosephosphate isomerase
MITKLFLVGNWKMNLLINDGLTLAREIVECTQELKEAQVWVAPSYLALPKIAELNNNTFKVGAQNCHWEDAGAYTGELSPAMLKECGAKFAIIGHSERRQYFGETDQSVALRAAKAYDSGLDVIVCVGETLAQREGGVTSKILKEQLSVALINLVSRVNQGKNRLLIAYEPVWAIGTGRVASLSEIAEAHSLIASTVKELGFQQQLPILYGGSVKPDNFGEIIKLDSVDGALVGGASLDFSSFEKLIALIQ